MSALQDVAPSVSTWLRGLWLDAVGIWESGGWAMTAIAATALVMFGLGTHVFLRLLEKGHRSVPERTWRRWIAHPDEREGPVGELLDHADEAGSLEAVSLRFEELRVVETRPFDRDLLAMKVCVSAAPLVGLLGTVTGMLTTFDALATGSGGEQTMQSIADGISEALITTETGLVIALPGLFFQYQLSRSLEGYKAFLAHLESVFTQSMHRAASRARLAAA